MSERYIRDRRGSNPQHSDPERHPSTKSKAPRGDGASDEFTRWPSGISTFGMAGQMAYHKPVPSPTSIRRYTHPRSPRISKEPPSQLLIPRASLPDASVRPLLHLHHPRRASTSVEHPLPRAHAAAPSTPSPTRLSLPSTPAPAPLQLPSTPASESLPLPSVAWQRPSYRGRIAPASSPAGARSPRASILLALARAREGWERAESACDFTSPPGPEEIKDVEQHQPTSRRVDVRLPEKGSLTSGYTPYTKIRHPRKVSFTASQNISPQSTAPDSQSRKSTGCSGSSLRGILLPRIS